MGMNKEFKEFVNQGNVIDLAVAVVLGAAFNKVVQSVVDDIVMPIIAALGGVDDIAEWTLGPIFIGKLLAAIINFLIIAFVLFLIIKGLNRAKKK